MSDSNILAAQIYLNKMYGGDTDNWVELDEDGLTGTLLCQGIIRAFQIENGIEPVTGNVGDITLEKMRSLDPISKMNVDDDINPNVCLLQCALFAKGYNAGGITGIYYTSGVNAVKQFQEDANIEVTGIVDWKVWMGLVSLNWFTPASNSDPNIALIQQQLNSDWSDIIGVGPCDGIRSRFTSYALIVALQAAEGIYTDFIGTLDGSNFGNLTTSLFPNVLKMDQNGDYIKYNKLVQYGLYFNGYDTVRYDGIFDSKTKSLIASFQKFYGLTDIGLVTEGEVNCATMKSLLTTNGDISRKALACDCSTVLNKQQALDLKAAGYQYVGRYLTGTVGLNYKRKFITFEEIENIKNAELKVFPIYQDGGYTLSYFQDLRQGLVDGTAALKAAQTIGVPDNTVIYFAVDFDCYDFQVYSFIVPYFKKLNTVFNSVLNTKNYKIGIYAPRYACTIISDLGLAKYSFVADTTSGYSCNIGYSIPKNWAFDQFYSLEKANGQFPSTPSFDLDKVGYSGRDTAIESFDSVTYYSPDELEAMNTTNLSDISKEELIYSVFEPLGYADYLTKTGFTYDKEFPITNIDLGDITVAVSSTITGEFILNDQFNISPITIELDSSGNLTTACESAFDNLINSDELDLGDATEAITGTVTNLKEVAVSMSSGVIGIQIETEDTYPKLSIVASTPDIHPDSDTVNEAMSIKISFKLIPNANSQYKVNDSLESNSLVYVAVVLFICSAIIGLGNLTAPAFVEFLGTLGILSLS